MTYGSAEVRLDEVELGYLIDLVERDQLFGGDLIGIDVLGNLAEAMDQAKEQRDGTSRES
ncbi:hypothetical protein SEA_LUCKYSOCKE_9 [Streptomyces phage LuckySocke]|jgi:hypothetical protein|nr:hypothetical protein SEA_ALONE_10 [Streptomyces phage Alone3]WPH59029.1 hypothetical protein SEA_LUCKYSOCKE_9 [Streptomyces phage LuckySocke]